MAIYRKPRNLKEWVLDCQPVTWCLHGLITLGIPAFVASHAWFAVQRWAFPALVTLAALGYICKEVFVDWRKHVAAGDQNKGDWQLVTAFIDGFADAGFPCMVMLGTWAGFLWALYG